MSALAAAALAVVAAPLARTIGATGWIFMLGSVGGVTALVVWCFRRVLRRDG